ncbi:MAG: hypothetical protein KGD63_04955 [Candidatus Lokiarchaeota archaeon]|nr:hypothetical protein [Candidatus Lokiarchaeota archaeon]
MTEDIPQTAAISSWLESIGYEDKGDKLKFTTLTSSNGFSYAGEWNGFPFSVFKRMAMAGSKGRIL